MHRLLLLFLWSAIFAALITKAFLIDSVSACTF